MNELVFLKYNDAFTDSDLIADAAGVKRGAVQKLISKYENSLLEYGKLRFEIRPSAKNQNVKIWLLNEQQATFIITLLKNTDKVIDFKKELVRQFYAMRKIILEKQTETWLETRKQGKLTRRAETDVIQQLIEYAKAQGSEHAQMLYLTYSKLAKRFAGIDSRDTATVFQLNNLSLMEHMILNTIQTGMMAGKHYKEIYQDCRRRLEAFSDIAYLEGGKMLAIG